MLNLAAGVLVPDGQARGAVRKVARARIAVAVSTEWGGVDIESAPAAAFGRLTAD